MIIGISGCCRCNKKPAIEVGEFLAIFFWYKEFILNCYVILKNSFRDFKDLNKSYLNFKEKLDKIKKKSFLLAISGGPDSLALAALSKAYSYERKAKFYYLMINHNIRKNSTKEAQQVKSLLKKNDISLKILTKKKKN